MTLCARLVPGCVVLLCVVALSFPLHSSAQSATSTPADVETRRQQLFSLFDEKWQYTLRTNPEWATMLGDSRYNDRLGDYSPEFFQIDLRSEACSFMPFSTKSGNTLCAPTPSGQQCWVTVVTMIASGITLQSFSKSISSKNINFRSEEH